MNRRGNNEQDLFSYRPPKRILQEGTLPPASRAGDQDTSAEAALDASPCARGNRLLALQLLLKCGPMTDYELAEVSGLQQNSIGKRRSECFQHELVEKHLVDDVVSKRPAPSGSMAIVWRISAKGKSFLSSLPLES